MFGWSVGQNKSFSKNSKTINHDKDSELGVSWQDMKNLGPKMSEQSRIPVVDPIIISGKAKRCSGGRSVKIKVFQKIQKL